jgi:hypothetical protein
VGDLKKVVQRFISPARERGRAADGDLWRGGALGRWQWLRQLKVGDDPPGVPVGPKCQRGFGRRGNFQRKSTGLPKTFAPKTRMGIRIVFQFFKQRFEF